MSSVAQNPDLVTSESSIVGAEPDGATPDYLIPTMAPAALHEPAYYRSLFLLDTLMPGDKPLEELKEPIDPFDEMSMQTESELRPAFGVLTVHEQTWRQTGLALGNLLQSVCLAPGEVTQIAVTRWEHKTRATSEEETEQRETVSSQEEQRRAVNEVQRAVATEAQWGASSAFSSSSSSQGGASFLFFGAASSSTTSRALTAQFSGGRRNLEVDSTSAIDQRTAETSQALRSRRQSVVREVSEEEAEALSTRVLANYNRRHALNVLFFEVLQKYEVRTVLKGWERCLFVPLVPLDFEKGGVLAAHQAELLDLFREFDATEMIEHLNRALGQEDAAAKVLAEYQLAKMALQHALRLAQEYRDCDVRRQLAREGIAAIEHSIELDQRGIDLIDKTQPKGGVNQREAYVRAIERHNRDKQYRLHEIASSEQRMNELKAEWTTLSSQHKELPPIDVAVGRIQSSIEEFDAKMAGYQIPVGKIFNRHRLFLSQQLWLRMSPYRIHRLLQGFTIVNRMNGGASVPGPPLWSLVDPQPIGVFGNYLAFRWSFPATAEGKAARENFATTYLGNIDDGSGGVTGEVVREVGLPTSGVFAEAVLGQGLAAEPLDDRFPTWGGKESRIPILPPKIADLQSRDRSHRIDFTASDFAPSLAQLRAEKLADISHIDKLLEQVGKGGMFRNMGGLAQAVMLADKLAALSTESATKAGDRAAQLQSKVLDVFEKVIASDVGKAAVAEFMLPGSGAAVLRPPNGSKAQDEGVKDEKK